MSLTRLAGEPATTKKRSLSTASGADQDDSTKRARTFAYVYVDKHNPPSDQLLQQIAKSDGDVRSAYRDYLQETAIMEEPYVAHLFLLLEEGADVVVGYVLGTTGESSVHIGNVYITESLRGLGMCVPLMVAYVTRLQLTGPIDSMDLYNAGGERSCRCYAKAFDQLGYIQKRPMDCSNPRKNEATMRAFKASTAGVSGGYASAYFGSVHL